MYKIIIKNTVTNQEYTYDNVEDKNNGKKLFFNFDIDTSNLDNGEYKLTLFDGDNIVSTELLKIGDYNSDAIQYSRGNNIYINAKPNIELSEISITENGEYNALSNNAWNKINVNISPKIDVAATGIKFGHSTFTEIPDIYNFENVTDATCMFYSCKNLTTIPLFDTSNVTNMEHMFAYCTQLTTIPTLDTSKVTDMSNMFDGCTEKLQSIPLLDTSNVTNMNYMFGSCRKLQSIPQFDTSKVANMDYMFVSCASLQSIPLLDCGNVTSMNSFLGYLFITALTDLGGFKDLKISVGFGLLNLCPNLTVESLMNVINNVYDLTANGLSGQSLKFGSTNLNKLTEEQIAVATAKGWTLTV